MRPIDADAMLDRLEEWNTDDPIDKALYNFAWNRIIEQPTIESEQRWIPVGEKLPEDDDYKPFSYYEDGAVLFCTKNGKIGFGWYYDSTKEWANEDDEGKDVVAWMPLPEPYTERREE